MTTIQTSVPDVTITENGVSVPEVADILSGRLTDMFNALSINADGVEPSMALSSPQGQIAMSDSEIVAQVYDKLLENAAGYQKRFYDQEDRMLFYNMPAQQCRNTPKAGLFVNKSLRFVNVNLQYCEFDTWQK